MIYKEIFCLMMLYSFSIIASENNSSRHDLVASLEQAIEELDDSIHILEEHYFLIKIAFLYSSLQVFKLMQDNRDLQKKVTDLTGAYLTSELAIENLEQIVVHQQQVIQSLLYRS